MDGPDGANEEGGHGVARTQSLGAESTARSMASGPRGVAFARSPQQSQSATLCIGEIETELHQVRDHLIDARYLDYEFTH